MPHRLLASTILLSFFLTVSAFAQTEPGVADAVDAPDVAPDVAADVAPDVAPDVAELAARPATVQLVPSFLMSYGGGATDNFGAGLQLRLDIHPTDRFPLRTGAYASGEILADGTVRVAGGLAGALFMVGCRVGLAYRSDTGGFASSLGLEIGKSFDFMGFSIGGRVTVPLVDFVSPNGGPTRVQGVEGQLVISVGWPFGLDGPTRSGCGCPHGRHAPSEAPAAIEEGATQDAPAIDTADGAATPS